MCPMCWYCSPMILSLLFVVHLLETPPPAADSESTQIAKPSIPVYIPTPKHILEARKSNGSGTTSDECVPSKKPKLEYVPKAISNSSAPIPTYIPSSVPNQTSTNDEYEPSLVFGNDNIVSTATDAESDLNGDDISGLLTELSNEQITNNANHAGNVQTDTNKLEIVADLKESQDHKTKENHHKSSSSSRHRHHSSSSHKSSRSDRKSSSSSSSRSSSSTHKSSHHSSRKSKHSDKDRDRDKDTEQSRHSSSSSKSSKESRHKSSEHRSKSSSSSSSRHHSSSHSDKKAHDSNNGRTKDCTNSSVVYETDSEDDDVEAQCRMIFEEFDPSMLESKQDEMPNGSSATSAEEDDSKVDDVTKKKRVAHENADKLTKSQAPFKKQTNHVANALQV